MCNPGYVLRNITNSPWKDESIAYKYHDNSNDCKACAVGQSTNGKAGEQFCSNCPVGLYSREGSAVCYDASGLIEDESLYIAEQMELIATRYHSLIVKKNSIPKNFNITATIKDGTVMAIEHSNIPIFGVQFHPESIATDYGHQLLKNFISFNTK